MRVSRVLSSLSVPRSLALLPCRGPIVSSGREIVVDCVGGMVEKRIASGRRGAGAFCLGAHGQAWCLLHWRDCCASRMSMYTARGYCRLKDADASHWRRTRCSASSRTSPPLVLAPTLHFATRHLSFVQLQRHHASGHMDQLHPLPAIALHPSCHRRYGTIRGNTFVMGRQGRVLLARQPPARSTRRHT